MSMLIVLALAVSSVSCTITLSKAFSWWREYLDARQSRFGVWLAALMHCPYCLSHYISAVLVAIYSTSRDLRPIWGAFDGPPLLDYAIVVFAVVAMAGGTTLVLKAAFWREPSVVVNIDGSK